MRTWKWIAVVIVAFIAVIAIFLSVFDWNLLRGYIGAKVTEKTGREFAINGNLDVDFLPFPPRIHAEQLRLANAEWGTGKTMLDIPQLDFSIRLLSLLKGDIVLPEVSLSDPKVLLEKSADGRRNWILKRQQSIKDQAPRIERLTVGKGTLTFRDPAIKTDMTVAVAPASTTQDARQTGIKFTAQGVLKGQPIKAEGQGGKVLSLFDQQTPYPLKADIQIGKTRALVDGTVTGLAALAAVNTQLDLRGDDLSDLFLLTGVSLPSTPPYRISGRLIRKGNTWQLDKFSGKVGDSDLAGDFNVDVSGKKPFVRANLISRKLDIDDLGGLIGAPPQTGAGETASAAQKKAAAQLASRARVLPNMEFKLDRLRAVDADVTLTAKSITGRKLPLDDLKAHLKLANGVLTLQPLNFGVAGGNVISNIVLRTRTEPATAQADITFKRLSLNKLFPTIKLTETSIGLIGGKAKFTGSGNSFAKLLATADGRAGFSMSGGQISNLLLEIIGIDGAEIIKFLFGGDETVAVRCMVADFKVNNGLMNTEVFVLDTVDTNITGDGNINLKDESIHLTLRPLPKDPSFLSARSPLFARGTFKKPTFAPDMQKVAARAGAAVVLGALLTPLAAIIPLIETGPGEDSDCKGLIAHIGKGSQAIKSTKPIPTQPMEDQATKPTQQMPGMNPVQVQ
ncbi:MAG: AsmA family protein [Gammaproteobacteria bacterium]